MCAARLVILGVLPCWLLVACGPSDSPAFVGRDSEGLFVGVQGCDGTTEPLKSVEVSEGSAEKPGPAIWRIHLTEGPPTKIVRVGVLPPGYVADLRYEASSAKRLSFHMTTVAGRSAGLAREPASIREGSVAWSGGATPGANLDSEDPSRWGC